MSKELEYKFLISETQKSKILEFLKINAKYLGEFLQKDTYFVSKFRDYEIDGETMECLRIRTTKTGSVLCYKKIHREANPIYCDEYETKIEDAENLAKILLATEFIEQMVIEKTRQSFLFGDCEFDFDSVKNLGEFVEIEFKGKDESKFDEIFLTLSQFGIFKENANYDGIQKLMKQKLGLN